MLLSLESLGWGVVAGIWTALIGISSKKKTLRGDGIHGLLILNKLIFGGKESIVWDSWDYEGEITIQFATPSIG